MKFPLRRALALAGVLWFSVAALHGSIPFPHDQSDLKPEPGVRFGKLPNGLRYAVMANSEPKGRASLRLLVNAGSLQEEEDQRGIAHFLEHMAFNGSLHYPPGTLIEFFQRIGMGFGPDTNASTSFDRTLYLLELSNTQTGTLDEGLKVFADYASGLLLQPAELDRERGIILSEKRARDTVNFRTFVADLAFTLPEARFAHRLPIGETEVISNAPRERFQDFYDTWYRPERISVIAVGDFSAEDMERRIEAAMKGLTARAPARPDPDLGRVSTGDGVRVHYYPEPEASITTVAVRTVTPFSARPDTAAERLSTLPRTVANAIINRRFATLARMEKATFVSAQVRTADQYDFFRESELEISAKPELWSDALAAGEQELRRALTHGFQPGELAEVRAAFINALEQSVRTAATRRSPALADDLANDLLRNRVSTDPQADLALFRPALERLTPADCLAALRDAWAPAGRLLSVSGNVVIAEGPSTIRRAYDASLAKPVAAPAAETTVAWAYTDFGPPGRVTDRTEVQDLGITQVRFNNGVRLNFKRTDFEASRVLFSTRIAGGSMTEPKGQRGLATLTSATFDAGGLGRHSTSDLQRILAGRTVSVAFRTAPDAFEFTGSASPKDLRLALEWLTAKITDPGYRPESLRLAQKGLEQMYAGFAHTPNGPISTEVANLIASGDPRFGTPPKDVMFSRTLDEVRAWLTPALRTGPLEIGIVGDFEADVVIEAVAATLGALPARGERADDSALRQVAFPGTPFNRSYEIDSKLQKGLALFYWPTTDGRDAHTSRRLGLLASVVTDRMRLRLREEMGGTYSPSARSVASDTFPGYGYLTSGIDIDPAAAEQIAEAVTALSAELHQRGVTEDELTRAKRPALTSIRESARSNAYWLNSVLARAQERPEVLGWARNREADVASITKAELDQLARMYLDPSRLSRAVVIPAAPSAQAPAKPVVNTP
jgi:zinc protease